MNDERPADPEVLLRVAYRDLQRPGSAEECPGEETLTALALGELADAQRDAIADHTIACRRCSTDYRILLATHEEASKEVPRAGNAATRRGRRPLLALAAVIALVAAGVLLVARLDRGPRAGSADTWRGGDAELDSRVAPRGGAALREAPAQLSWPARRDAESYRVKLFDSAGDTLWESPVTSQTRVVLPDAARSRLSAGQSYFWVVEVEASIERERLGPFSFSLAPKGLPRHS